MTGGLTDDSDVSGQFESKSYDLIYNLEASVCTLKLAVYKIYERKRVL